MSIVAYLTFLVAVHDFESFEPFFIIRVGVPLEITALHRNVNYAGDTYTGDYLSLGRFA